MKALQRSLGYTMGEMIVVVVLLGVLGLLAVPVYSGIRRSSLETAAMHSARLINAARESYALTVPNSGQAWEASTSDESRLALLVGEGLLSGVPADYLSMPGNYSVAMTGAVRSPTVLLHEQQAILY